jgi:hypothetical protein
VTNNSFIYITGENMKKTNVLLLTMTLVATQFAFATDYKCDDSLKTVVHYTKEKISIAGTTYELDASGISANDDTGVFVTVDAEKPGQLEIGFQDSTDGGDLIDNWSCAEVK